MTPETGTAAARAARAQQPAPTRPSPGLPPFDPEHEQLAETATDPLELAALLEAEGLTDGRVREDFGHESVFAYAEGLFARSPRRTVAGTRGLSEWTFSPARSTARLAPILTVLFLQAALGSDRIASLSKGELAAALIVPMLGSAIVLAPAGYLGSRYVACGYTRPGAVATLRLLWVGSALLALGVVTGTIAATALGYLGSSWSFAAVGLVSAALWGLVCLLLTLERPRHVHGAVAAAIGVGFLAASFAGATVGAAAGAGAFALLGVVAVALCLQHSPPMTTRVPPLRRQARSLFPAAFYGVLGPVIILADWPAARAFGIAPQELAALTTGATFAVLAAVLLYELHVTRLQAALEDVLGATEVGADEQLVAWATAELRKRRRLAVSSVAALVAGTALVAAALALGDIGLTPTGAAFFVTTVAAYAVVGILCGELLVLVWLGRAGPAVGIQAAMAGLAVALCFPAVALLGLWGAAAAYLLLCPAGIVLTRRATRRAVGEGAYSFYRAAF